MYTTFITLSSLLYNFFLNSTGIRNIGSGQHPEGQIIWRPVPQDGTQDGTQKQLEEKIISLIKANPKISRKDIATATQTSPRTIARRIKEMNDKIRFVGSGYSGHWEVIGSKD